MATAKTSMQPSFAPLGLIPSSMASSSASSPPTPGAGPSIALHCGACGEPTTMLCSAPRGSNPLKRWHLCCLATWRSFLRKTKRNPSLKAEFDGKNEAEQQLWFREQKRTDDLKNKRRSFGDIHCVQSQEQSVGMERKERDIGKTYTMYEAEQLALGRGAGSIPDIKNEWQQFLTCGRYEVEKVRGEDIVYFFAGVVRDKVEADITRATIARSAQVATADELQKSSGQNATTLKRVAAHLSAALPPPVSNPAAPQVPGTMIVSALRPTAPAEMANTFERQLVQAAQEEAQHEQELLDIAVAQAGRAEGQETEKLQKRRKTITYEKLEAKDKVRTAATKIDKFVEETRACV